MVVLTIHSGWDLGGSTHNVGFVVRTLTRRSHVVYVLNRYEDDEGSRFLTRCGAQVFCFPPFSLQTNTTVILESSGSSLKREALTALHDLVKWPVGFVLTLRYIVRYRPDVLYVTDSGLLQCALAAKCLGVPVVAELQAELIRGRSGLRRSWYAALLRRMDVVFGITDSHVQPLLSGRDRPPNIHVVPNTVDAMSVAAPAVGDVRARYGVRHYNKVVAFFGGASAIKGCRRLLDIVRALVQVRSDVVCLLAGPFHVRYASKWAAGSSRSGEEDTRYLFDFIRENGLEQAVRPIGEVTNVIDIMRQSDLVISTNAFPHFSRTIMEAFYCSVPVLAARDKFSIEMVADGANGLLSDFDDIGEWLTKAQAVLDDPQYGQRLGAAGRRTYEAAFDQQPVATRLIEIFEGASCRTRSGPPLPRTRAGR